jgi:Uma2 family endonuclease
MSDAGAKLMTVDEFLVWGEGREGRWELRDGVVVAMSPERVAHLETKANAFLALSDAIRRAKAPCRVYPDGATVRISRRTAFEPDALVRCGPPLAPDALEIPDPIIVVEVLSPSTEAYDRGAKFEGYFSPPSVMHYLIIDADRRKIVHHKRGAGDIVETRVLASGPLILDPPGLELTVESFFAPG